MSTPQELITDAQFHITKAEKSINEGAWQRGIFELGCAHARILQVVELFAVDFKVPLPE